jgi:hypothetical protein
MMAGGAIYHIVFHLSRLFTKVVVRDICVLGDALFF